MVLFFKNVDHLSLVNKQRLCIYIETIPELQYIVLGEQIREVFNFPKYYQTKITKKLFSKGLTNLNKT